MNNDGRKFCVPDRVKNILIIFLSVSALFLSTRTGMYSQLFHSSPFISSALRYLSEFFTADYSVSAEDAKGYSQAAKPFAVLTRSAGDEMYVSMWNSDDLESAYDSYSAALGEALGSAGEASEITEQSYRSLLENNSCVYFDFYYPQQLSLLAGWLGTSMSDSHTTSAVLLAESPDSGSVLCYMDYSSGVFYRCLTELSWSSVSSKLAEHNDVSAKLAYMLGYSNQGLDPYTIIPDKTPQKNSFATKNPFRINLLTSSVLSVFSMNSYIASVYQESDGTTVYVESDRTLRISPDGCVIFRSAETSSQAISVSTADCLELAYQLVSSCAGLCSSDLDIYLIAADRQSGECTFTFGYVLDGIPLVADDGSFAAQVRVNSAGINWASILFRSYEDTGESVVLLPASLQAAVIQTTGGGKMFLTYSDNGLTAEPQWSAY